LGPLNISVKGEYALLALFDLAMQPPGQPVKIAAIARRQGIPQKFLELILASLKQGGFVESRRGADGGYLLARAAEAITVGEVLRYVEGGRDSRSNHRRRTDSPFSDLWGRVERSVSDILDRSTMADVSRAWTEKQNRYVPNWDI
jgi:Rrf2 family protein